MVKIIEYRERTNSDGEQFFALICQGSLEMIKSKETGKFYATAKSASVASTFTEDVCKSLIGEEIPGSIKRIECEPFEYVIEETGEVITLTHRWEYRAEGDTMEDIVFQEEPVGAELLK